MMIGWNAGIDAWVVILGTGTVIEEAWLDGNLIQFPPHYNRCNNLPSKASVPTSYLCTYISVECRRNIVAVH